MPHTRKAIATEFISICAHGHSLEAFQRHVHPDFVHHNPYFTADAEALRKAMEEDSKANPHKAFHIVHLMQDGDMIAIHSRMKQTPEADEVALVHLFRFSEDKIIELWDISQPAPKSILNEKGMF